MAVQITHKAPAKPGGKAYIEAQCGDYLVRASNDWRTPGIAIVKAPGTRSAIVAWDDVPTLIATIADVVAATPPATSTGFTPDASTSKGFQPDGNLQDARLVGIAVGTTGDLDGQRIEVLDSDGSYRVLA